MNLFELSFFGKEFLWELSRKSEFLWDIWDQFYHLSQMVIILPKVGSSLWFKQEITSQHFKKSAGQGPQISSIIIFNSNNDFRWSILSSLYLWAKVMMVPASISKIDDLQSEVISQLCILETDLLRARVILRRSSGILSSLVTSTVLLILKINGVITFIAACVEVMVRKGEASSQTELFLLLLSDGLCSVLFGSTSTTSLSLLSWWGLVGRGAADIFVRFLGLVGGLFSSFEWRGLVGRLYAILLLESLNSELIFFTFGELAILNNFINFFIW